MSYASDAPASTPIEPPREISLSDRDFLDLALVVEGHIGIKMPQTKKPLVASRLLRRLRGLAFDNYHDYCQYIRSPQGWQLEEPYFSDLVTTHKTQFFREPEHFSYLVQQLLPQLLDLGTGSSNIALWSAACSTGEEVYTLAMVLQDYRNQHTKHPFEFSITGTDISEFVLRTAGSAIYSHESTSDIPVHLRNQFLMRGKDSHEGLVRITPTLRALCKFRPLNFMDSPWSIRDRFDVIFCRNVLIYFNAERQHQIIAGLCDHLEPGGHLFLGHAETANVSQLPLTALGHTIYKKFELQGKPQQRSGW
jgi:chemotaxis protein methyltransferase CheR